MASSRWSDWRLWVLLAGTVAGLGIAFAVKAPCLEHFGGGDEYRRLCYNDIQPLYYWRGMNNDTIPYHDYGTEKLPDGQPRGFVEYPVLTGLFMWVAALLTPDDSSTGGAAFFAWNAALLSLCALATTVLLYDAVEDKRRVAIWCGGPPLVLYAFHNWDLLAVLLGVLGLGLFARQRPLASGIALGLGLSAKIYPGLFAPILGVELLRREHGLRRSGWRFGIGFAAAVAAVNLPFALSNFRLWWATYAFHVRRTTTYESPWYVLVRFLQERGVHGIALTHLVPLFNVAAALVFLGGLALFAWRVGRGRLPWLYGCLGSLLLFLVLNKVFSVQYMLWLLPFFVLLPLSWEKFGAAETGDVSVYATLMTFFGHLGTPQERQYWPWVQGTVLWRLAALAWILGHVVRRGWKKEKRPAPGEAGAPAAGGLSAATTDQQEASEGRADE